MSGSPTICFDYDFLLFQAACVVEKRTIKVVNKITSEELIFKNRTEFYGHYKNKNGGWLAEQNTKRTTPYQVDDFFIEDSKVVEPIENAIHILNQSIKSICSQLNTNKYYGYTARGKTFREDIATLLPYKGNRENMEKPIHLEELKDYVNLRHDGFIVDTYEADDYCAMDAWHHFNLFKKTGNEKDKLINVAIDKDAKGVTSFLFNPNKYFEPIMIEGVGSLYEDEKDIDGRGRAWFYFQVANGDSTDNFNPSCFSDGKYGKVSAYNALKGCSTDKQYWQALVNYFKKMYPEPKDIVNFRGDAITIDYLYVLQEMVDMAWMKRFEEDRIDVKSVLEKLEVSYD